MDALLVGKLIEKCTQLESALKNAGATGSGLKELAASVPLAPETEKDLKFVRRIRNACAHDGEVSDDEIRDALQVAEKILKRGIVPPEKPPEKLPKTTPKKAAATECIKHFLILEIFLVLVIYAVAFAVSLTPEMLNVATVIATYLVLSWEIIYAGRCGNRRALKVEIALWLVFPLLMWCGAPGKTSSLIIVAVSGLLPLFHVGIVTQNAVYPALIAVLSAVAGGGVRYFFGNAAGIAALLVVAALSSLSGVWLAAGRR